jgi:phosphatidylglycerophosphate synthase
MSTFVAAAQRASYQLAWIVCAGLTLALATRRGCALALFGGVGVARLAWQLRSFRAVNPRPDSVTSLRLLGCMALASYHASVARWQLGALVFAILALDGLDGLVARNLGAESRRGAHFDMECDAFLIMCVSFVHAQQGLGFLCLSAGLLRYAYVILTRLFPSRGEAPRSQLGRYAFGSAVCLFAGGFLTAPGWLAQSLIWLATAVLTVSFARSFAWAFVLGTAGAERSGAERG